VNALANDEVGDYLNSHFVASYQKVGTFQVLHGEKNGGNVASYFCLPDGSVLHAIAGPVDAATFLREARWVVDTRKLAMTESRSDFRKYRAFFRKAHADRLRQEHHVDVNLKQLPDTFELASFTNQATDKRGRRRPLGLQGQIHWLLTTDPLVKIEEVYPTVFEKILGEKLSTLPVLQN
jgi:hypothetical protein